MPVVVVEVLMLVLEQLEAADRVVVVVEVILQSLELQTLAVVVEAEILKV